MNLNSRINICSSNYKKWKELALNSKNLEEARKRMKRAFFWIELQSAFLFLDEMEKMSTLNDSLKNKVVLAKANLARKLSEYAKTLLDEL